MKYLLAFDKFKGSLTAEEAVETAARAVRQQQPDATILPAPLTDGGEGFAAVLATAMGAEVHEVEVPGPLFAPVKARFATLPLQQIPRAARDLLDLPDLPPSSTIAFAEMASASGYQQVPEPQRDPFQTTSFGTGRLLQKAAESGAKAVVLGIGGSATNDCGAGALEAFGALFYDRDLQPVTSVSPAKFSQIASVGSTSHHMTTFPPVRIACDVTNPLLGPQGATAVYGPQKGLRAQDAERLERSMHRMASRILGLYGRDPARWEKYMAEPGSGAAGGIGFALRQALPDARFLPGFPLIAACLDLAHKAAEADVVFTGEGRFDASSLSGKGPVGLLRLLPPRSRAVLLAGSIEETAVATLQNELSGISLSLQAISDPDWPIETALARAPDALSAAVHSHLPSASDS